MLVYRAAPMEWQGWFTLGVVVLTLAGMVREVAGPDLVMMAGLFALAAAGVLTPAETFSGFANPALAAVGVLFVVSAGLRETGALDLVVSRLFRGARTEWGGLARICPPVAAISAFLNNAPIVAMMTPVVLDWTRRRGLSASRLLIPLSYSAMLGSITTVIGTSTTLTVAGLVLKAGMPEIRFFELSPVGIPIALVGLLYLQFVAPRLIVDRKAPTEQLGERRREYTAAMHVEPGCELIGRSIEDAGLRHLPGLFLVEIERAGRVITPVGPDEIVQAGDQLVFAGVVSTIVELQRIRGLVPVSDGEEPARLRPEHRMLEAVISPSSPLVDQSIRDANFRTVYDAAVIAVHRNGRHVPGKIGEIVLEAGDTLLLQGAPGFLRAHRNSPDFYLVSEIPGTEAPRYERAWLAIAILAAMVITAASGLYPISIAAFLAAGALIATRCINGRIARRSVNWSILVVIGAGFGIAAAMEKTGAAAAVAGTIAAASSSLGPIATLAGVYLMTLLLAELLHHNAAVAIMFPIAVATAAQIGADARPFVMGVVLGGCCAFASPVAYQTHLIVYGAGGYRFTDFVRTGVPLDLLCATIALTLIPWIWPLF
ncbi:MAG: SLC13 family permease [Myxococcales bacterium]|nr:SLC13 family permease [Myxococcales bacterium]